MKGWDGKQESWEDWKRNLRLLLVGERGFTRLLDRSEGAVKSNRELHVEFDFNSDAEWVDDQSGLKNASRQLMLILSQKVQTPQHYPMIVGLANSGTDEAGVTAWYKLCQAIYGTKGQYISRLVAETFNQPNRQKLWRRLKLGGEIWRIYAAH